VLRNFSKDGRATLEIQETSGAVTKKRYNGTTSQGAAPLEIPARPLGELNQGIISCAGI